MTNKPLILLVLPKNSCCFYVKLFPSRIGKCFISEDADARKFNQNKDPLVTRHCPLKFQISHLLGYKEKTVLVSYSTKRRKDHWYKDCTCIQRSLVTVH
jgi:hypothetical protein